MVLNEEQQVMIVDGMALLFRGYYANSYGGYIRKTNSGMPTNAIYGFVKYLLDAVHVFRPSHVVCCWDLGSRTFRSEKYAAYKANRPEPPADLIPQFDMVKDVVSSFRIPNVSAPGYEADDCIGTLAKSFSDALDVLILSGDHDMLQLVSERTQVALMKKGPSNYGVYDPMQLQEEKQLTPAQIIDLKGLIGDTADNYPGVRGIGEKTALKLLNEYGNIDGIIQNISLLPRGVRLKIEQDLDMLYLCRDLATIRCDAPVAIDVAECSWSPDAAQVHEMLDELELRSLIKTFETVRIA